MSSYALSIVAYDRGYRWDAPDKKKPYHWAFLIQTGTSPDIRYEFQLHGMPGNFYYSAEENVDIEMSSSSKNGQLEVGSIPLHKYERFKDLLKAVPIDNVESSTWNCQSWSLAALDSLREEGIVTDDYPNNVIQYWFREDQ